jgi:hypothetical protein
MEREEHAAFDPPRCSSTSAARIQGIDVTRDPFGAAALASCSRD